MNPGIYNRKITLRTIDNTTEAVSTLAVVWASIKPISGQRLLVYEQLQMGVWFDIKTPYRKDLTLVPGDPILLGSETLTVHSVIDPENGHWEWKIKAFVKRG